MGSCLSKKGLEKKNSSDTPCAAAPPYERAVSAAEAPCEISTNRNDEQEAAKKESSAVLVSGSDISKEKDTKTDENRGSTSYDGLPNASGSGGAFRTSSCTKEELDAILIHCGKLSRSSSGKTSSNGVGSDKHHPRSNRYSGSKRSYDFDDHNPDGHLDRGDDDKAHQPPVSSRPHHHRRTPSGERDAASGGSSSQLKRCSSSGDEGRKGAGRRRRTSRSPGRRSETPTENAKRPTKMVSVPATTPKGGASSAPSLSITPAGSASYPRRSAASPRSRSPAAAAAGRSAGANENGASQPSLSRSSSRKAETSPFRRNPMNEMDENALSMKMQQAGIRNAELYKSNTLPQSITRKGHEGTDNKATTTSLSYPAARKSSDPVAQMHKQRHRNGELVRGRALCELPQQPCDLTRSLVSDDGIAGGEKMECISEALPAEQCIDPPKITRSKSSRRSRDLDHLLPNFSYAPWLMDEKKEAADFTLPPCVSKACSILEAVADLNSNADSNMAASYDEADGAAAVAANRHHRLNSSNSGSFHGGLSEKRLLAEIRSLNMKKSDERITQLLPSLKYVTIRDLGGGEMDEQESAGSNSFFLCNTSADAGAASPAPSWEPNSSGAIEEASSSSRSGSKCESIEQKMLRSDGSTSDCTLRTSSTMRSSRRKETADNCSPRYPVMAAALAQ